MTVLTNTFQIVYPLSSDQSNRTAIVKSIATSGYEYGTNGQFSLDVFNEAKTMFDSSNSGAKQRYIILIYYGASLTVDCAALEVLKNRCVCFLFFFFLFFMVV